MKQRQSSPQFRSVLMISNPGSRSGDSDKLDDCITKLGEAGNTIIHVKSKSPQHSVEEIHSHRHNIDLVIAAGGDGTISSMAGAIHDTQLPLAILPLGTANDLAKSIGIPDDLDQACEAIIAGHTRRIDLGKVNDHYFFNAVNLGLGTEITHELTQESKQQWGVLSYAKALLNAVRKRHAFTLNIGLDNRKMSTESLHVGIGNGRFYGGGNVINDNCDITDGHLAFYSIKPASIVNLMGLAPLIRFGKQRITDDIITQRAHRVTLETQPASMEIHADGEPVTHTPATVVTQPKAIAVVCPKQTFEPSSKEVPLES